MTNHHANRDMNRDMTHDTNRDTIHDTNRSGSRTSRALDAARMRNALLKSRATLPALAAVAALGGCVAVGGSRSMTQPTVGRELIDLKAAHEAGAIDAAEYAAAKQRLLEGERRSFAAELPPSSPR